jgi:glycosyltransferase involved in cell wall biosynthesis
MPVYNEKRTLLDIIEKIKKLKLDKEIVIIDDGSTDGTRDILRKEEEKKDSPKIFYGARHAGKGAAIRTGLRYVTGDLVIIQDADLEYEPEEYSKLIGPILEGKAEIVYGSRFLKRPLAIAPRYYVANKFLTWLTNILYRTRLTDMETCYKVFKTEIIKSIDLECNRFEFEPEVTAKLIKAGYKIYEVPVSYCSRSRQEGKKVSWRDGWGALYTLIKYRLGDW